MSIIVVSTVVVAAVGCTHWSPGKSRTARGPVADNSRCHVCHINYEDEPLAVTHRQVGVGCERCHGASDAHCADEDNVTPPEIMYPTGKINAACGKCHPSSAIDIRPHEPLFDGSAPENEQNCTDCHGQHRLAYRTRQWDKATGALRRHEVQ